MQDKTDASVEVVLADENDKNNEKNLIDSSSGAVLSGKDKAMSAIASCSAEDIAAIIETVAGQQGGHGALEAHPLLALNNDVHQTQTTEQGTFLDLIRKKRPRDGEETPTLAIHPSSFRVLPTQEQYGDLRHLRVLLSEPGAASTANPYDPRTGTSGFVQHLLQWIHLMEATLASTSNTAHRADLQATIAWLRQSHAAAEAVCLRWGCTSGAAIEIRHILHNMINQAHKGLGESRVPDDIVTPLIDKIPALMSDVKFLLDRVRHLENSKNRATTHQNNGATKPPGHNGAVAAKRANKPPNNQEASVAPGVAGSQYNGRY